MAQLSTIISSILRDMVVAQHQALYGGRGIIKISIKYIKEQSHAKGRK